MAESFSAASPSTASASVRSRWLDSAASLASLTTPHLQHTIDTSRIIQNKSKARRFSANSATTLWSAIGEGIEAMTLWILFTIVATMTLGFLFALVFCNVLRSIKEDASQTPHLAQNNATHNAPKITVGGYEDSI
jgi:hypothetical protein